MSRRLAAALLVALLALPALPVPAFAATVSLDANHNVTVDGTRRFRFDPDSDMMLFDIYSPKGVLLGRVYLREGGEVEVKDVGGQVVGTGRGSTELEAAQVVAGLQEVLRERVFQALGRRPDDGSEPAPTAPPVARATPTPGADAPPAIRGTGAITLGPADRRGSRAIFERGVKVGRLSDLSDGDMWVFQADESWIGTFERERDAWAVGLPGGETLGRVRRGDDADLAAALERYLPAMRRAQATKAAAAPAGASSGPRARSVAAIDAQPTPRGGWKFVIDGALAGSFEQEGRRWMVRDHKGARLGVIEPKSDPSQGWEILNANGGRIGDVDGGGRVNLDGRRSPRWRSGDPLYKLALHVYFGPDAP